MTTATAMTGILLLGILLGYHRCASGLVISSSKIERCIRSAGGTTDGGAVMTECEQRIVVTLAIEGGATAGSSTIEATLQEVTDADTGEVRKLAHPIAVALSKSRPEVMYPLRYVQSVNNQPRERQSSKLLMCGSGSSTLGIDLSFGLGGDDTQDNGGCGHFVDAAGEPVPYSGGFCCPCDFGNMLPGTGPRRAACVGLPLGPVGSGTSHCLRFDELWYNAYEVGPAEVSWDIGVAVAAMDEDKGRYAPVGGDAMWLSPSTPAASTADGSVQVRVVGDLAPFRSVPVLSDRHLFVPDTPGSHPRVAAGLASWMLVGREMSDFSGNTCDRIGVSFAAFANQGNRCLREAGSCLLGQLDQLHREDEERRSAGHTPVHFLDHLGAIDTAADLDDDTSGRRHRALRLRFDEAHSTLVTLTLRADDVRFVVASSPGRIDAVSVRSFEAQSRDGYVDAVVANAGTIEAAYTVEISSCTTGAIAPVPARRVSLGPGGHAALEIPIRSTNELGDPANACLLRLIGDADLTVWDTRTLNFSTAAVKVERGAQGGATTAEGAALEDPAEAPDFESTSGGCSACSNLFDVVCRTVRGCWSDLATSALVIVLIIVAVPVAVRALVWIVRRSCTPVPAPAPSKPASTSTRARSQEPSRRRRRGRRGQRRDTGSRRDGDGDGEVHRGRSGNAPPPHPRLPPRQCESYPYGDADDEGYYSSISSSFRKEKYRGRSNRYTGTRTRGDEMV